MEATYRSRTKKARITTKWNRYFKLRNRIGGHTIKRFNTHCLINEVEKCFLEIELGRYVEDSWTSKLYHQRGQK